VVELLFELVQLMGIAQRGFAIFVCVEALGDIFLNRLNEGTR